MRISHAHDSTDMLENDSVRSLCAVIGHPGGGVAFSSVAGGAASIGGPLMSDCGTGDPAKISSSTELFDTGVYAIIKVQVVSWDQQTM